MKRLSVLLSLFAVLVVAGAVWLSGCERQAPSEDDIVLTDEIDVIPVSGDSALVIETEVVTVFEELHRHIEDAQRYADAGRTDSAAAALYRTATLLNTRAADAGGTAKNVLQDAAVDGERLARSLRNGTSVTRDELSDFMARADVALVGFHLQRAELALDAGRPARAGQHLHAAARLYEYAALHGEGVTEAQADTHHRMRETARWLQAENPDPEAARREIGGYVRDYEALRRELALLAQS